MQDFSQALAAWQPFFITLASLCATLAGLLFVALSLHPMNKQQESRANLYRLAQHTFADFVQVLFVGVFFIVPAEPPDFYGVAVVVIVVASVREMSRRVLESWRDRSHAQHRAHFLRRVGLSLLGRGLLCLGGVMLLLAHVGAVQIEQDILLVFSGSLLLLISALRNAWFLLLEELG